MMSQVMRTVSEGLGLWPVISLVLFFIVFVGMLIVVVRMKRSHIDHMGSLPLDNAEPGDTTHA